MTAKDTETRILDQAEQMARQGGYGGFSFREIADRIGIKSASVHYHFRPKEDLGQALVSRYTDAFLEALGAPDAAPPDEMLHRYVQAYRHALVEDGQMCLCGLFGAEIADLPGPVAQQTRVFFARNLEWLGQVFARAGDAPDKAHRRAARLLAALQGAMILARSLDDPALFDLVARNARA